jgi:hypothetical protein
VLALREEHDSRLRGRDHREERGDGERQHRRSNHRRGDRGASARDAVTTTKTCCCFHLAREV